MICDACMESSVDLHIPAISVIQLDIAFYSSAKQKQQWYSVQCGYLSKRNPGLTSTEKKFISTLDIYLGQCVKKLSISVLVVAENNGGELIKIKIFFLMLIKIKI